MKLKIEIRSSSLPRVQLLPTRATLEEVDTLITDNSESENDRAFESAVQFLRQDLEREQNCLRFCL